MAKHDKKAVWRDVIGSVKVAVSTPVFKMWVSQTRLLGLRKVDKKRYIAEVGCESTYVKQTVEQKFYGLLQEALMKTINAPSDLTFVVKPQTQKDILSSPSPLFSEGNKEGYLEAIGRARLRPDFTFENYAVSGSNQMAWAAAEAVAARPGKTYNPLFVWGGVGVGKTHIMQAVGHKMLKNSLESKILVCTSEEFSNDMVEGIRNKTSARMREKYRQLDALFIDDIQFIAGKEKTQEEFFHTFNTLVNSGRQIILTSDKPPSELTNVEPRLKSRFEAGMIVDISEPDFELKCAIIQIKALERGLELDNELVELIAGNANGARPIEGMLTRLMTEMVMNKVPLTEDLVKSVISSGKSVVYENGEARSRTNPEEVINAVCSHYNLGRRVLLGKGRANVVVLPRQILMYILRTELRLPYMEVGRIAGGRDHSTVMHGVEKITDLNSKNADVRGDISRIKKYVWG